VLLAACGDAADSTPRAIVEDFVDRSVRVTCEPLTPPAAAPSPGLMADATDSTFLVYPVNETRVVTLDARLHRVQEVQFEREGPSGVAEVRAIAGGADGSVWIADGKARDVKAFGPEGLRRSVRADFFPSALAGGPGGLFVAQATGGEAKALVHVLDGDVFKPTNIVPLRRPDFLLAMLYNQVNLASLPAGRVVAAHVALEPIAHFWTREAGARVVALPYPDEAKRLLDYTPVMPILDEDIRKMPAGALALSVDGLRGELLILTRSGREREDASERAIIRTDGDLGYLRSYLLDVHAVHMVYLARLDASIVVDESDRWFRCPTP
jgi:hypothetical protein